MIQQLPDTVGIIGKNYAEVRQSLTNKGWVVVVPDFEPDTIPPQPDNRYPEITCGNGRQAICSATLRHSGSNPDQPSLVAYRIVDRIIAKEQDLFRIISRCSSYHSQISRPDYPSTIAKYNKSVL